MSLQYVALMGNFRRIENCKKVRNGNARIKKAGNRSEECLDRFNSRLESFRDNG